MPKKSRKHTAIKSFSKNKKAFAFFEILEKVEAGIVLNGSEVKSIKNGHAQLKGSFVDIKGTIAFVNNMHISRYKCDSNSAFNPLRKRKLLLHKKEIIKLSSFLNNKGTTIIPLELYEKHGIIKLLIGVCRGKKMYDRREELKKKAQNLEISHALKKFKR